MSTEANFVSQPSLIQPSLLSKINERQVLRTIQAHGPLSRAEVARYSGISAPTASKAVESLLRAGLLEEGDAPELGRGRPAKKLRLASETAQVLGLVVDTEQCRVAVAGLDGQFLEQGVRRFPTPATYDGLLNAAVEELQRFIRRDGVTTLGLGISLPGLMDHRHQRGVLSPNLPITNGHAPGADLSERLGLECVVVQELNALCLAERYYGAARGINDFAMLDVSTGVGLGVISGGRLLTGHNGLAGEIGHLTVEIDGRQCGCGNTGCLETMASDSALAWAVSQRLGRKVTVYEVIQMIRSGELNADAELERTCRYLAVGVAGVINMFNPSHLFVHGHLFEASDHLFSCMVDEARRRALPPSFAECQIIQARGSKRQGAVAAIIEHLTNSVVPELPSDAYSLSTAASV